MKTRILYILFLLFVSVTTLAQEMRLVSGTINADDGEPLIGCSVKERGTNNATITDIDGYYEIIAPLGSTLEYTFIGMKTSTMVVSSSNSKPYTGSIINMRPEKKTDEEKPEMTFDRQDKSLSPYFQVLSDSPQDAWMPLRKTEVTAFIAGVIADVSVKQIYVNESKNTLEAIYVFPGSTRAAVYGMAMTIGDRRIEAQIKKKEQARQEYEQAKQEGKSTTLLEQHRPNVFQMNVANILPGDTIVVEMKYTELLEHEAGVYEFVYPTVVGPRYTETNEDWVARSTAQFEKEEKPEFTIYTNIQTGRIPIQKISSISHNVTISSPSPASALISLSNPKDNQGDRDYIVQYELQGGKVQSGLLCYEHGDENFFLLMMQPPKKPTPEQIPPREYVFIIDVSGSMYGFPLRVSKELIRNLISGLRPSDRFNVMLFESSNAMLYKESVAATEENIEKAMKVIDEKRGSGGTDLYNAIVNAMNFKETEGFSRTFIIATDGFVTVEKQAFNYIRSNLGKANLFPFGIGSNVNRYIIEGLAHAGMGTPYVVTNISQAEEIGSRVIEEISEPVLTNISIDWGDFDVYDIEPVAVPDVFADRPVLVYGKYKSPARGTITVSGLSGETMYEQKFDVSKASNRNNQALRYLWARNQIRYYDDYAQFYEGSVNGWHDSYNNHQRSPQQIEYVTNLGLKYNLLTNYTSFLAVDHQVRKPKPVETTDNFNYQQQKTKKSSSSYKKSRSSSSSSSWSSTTSTSSSLQLSSDEAQLEEVVVVGYGTTRRYELTSSVVSVSSGQITNTGHSLQGRVAGLTVSQTSGEPGSSSKMRIRGSSSIMDNNNPLLIVDGVPMEHSDLSKLNADNIEDITVLKDASATAIYGSRASNGVLLVTTKQPSYKKLSVSFTSSFSMETPNRLPDLQNQFAQGRPVNGVPTWNQTSEAFSWGPDVKSANASTYDAYDILQTGLSFRNNLTVSERRQELSYTLKLGNNTQSGFIPDSKFVENSIGLRVGTDKSRKFNYNIDLNYYNTWGRRLQRGYNMSGIMQGILLTPPTFDNQKSTLENGTQRSAGNAADNPYWTLDNNPFSDETNRIIGSINLGYKLLRDLSFDYQLGGDYMDGKAKTALNRGSVYMPEGHSMTRDEEFKSANSRLSAKYDKQLNDFNLSATVGHEYSRSIRKIDRLDGYKLAEPGDYNIHNTDSIVPYKQSFDRYSNAIFGKATVNYKNKIIMSAAMRGEWSSVNDNTLYSPSVGVAFNLHEMFYSQHIDLLRLYANASRADKETPLYLDPAYFNSAIYNLNDASNHFESREVIVDNLKPESIRHYEIGANIAVLNNRLSLSASMYWKNGKNQLLPVQASASSVQLENSGTLKTRGIEAQLDFNILRNRNFNWNTGLAFSRERNKTTGLGDKKLMLAGIEGVAGSFAANGRPLGVLYGTTYKRNEQGQMMIDSNGFPIKNDELSVIGDPNPDFRLSWLNSLEYRNFSLSVMLDWKKGGDMWNGTRNVMNYYGTSQYSADHRNTVNYVFPGVLANGSANNIPVNFYGNNLEDNRWVRYGQYGVGEDAIQDAGYLKLREVTLGYRFPIRLFNERTFMKLSLFATNILLFSKYKGVDPDTNLTGSSNGFGLDYFNIPGVQSIGMSLNWQF